MATAQAEFQNLSRKADDVDPDELWPERLKLREVKGVETRSLMRDHFGDKFRPRRMQSAETDVRGFIEGDEHSLHAYVGRVKQKKRNMKREKVIPSIKSGIMKDKRP